MLGIKEYVVGFAFSPDGSEVVLVRKNRPEWQKGCFNGVGGSCEIKDKSPYYSQRREFLEETGVELDIPTPNTRSLDKWEHYGTMDFNNDPLGGFARVYCFRIFTDKIKNCKTQETEEIRIVPVKRLLQGRYKTTPNVKLLVELALRKDVKFVDLTFE